MSETTAAPTVTVETAGDALTLRTQSKLLDDDLLKAVNRAVDQRAAAGSGITRVVLDMSPVRLVPSLALGLLVQHISRCRSRNQKLALAGVDPQVRLVFSI